MNSGVEISRDRAKIAVFDSGVGGITLLHRLTYLMPREDYLYYADSANTPYGDRSNAEVKDLVKQAIAHISAYPMKALVIACNTVDSQTLHELRQKSSVPVIGMQPAMKPPRTIHDPRKILVAATQLALRNRKFETFVSNLEPSDIAVALPMQELVNFAEEFDFNSPELRRYLRKTFKNVNWDAFHTLVLGSTHFLYYRELLREMIPAHVSIIDGHHATAKNIRQLVKQESEDRNYKIHCSLSGKIVETEIISPYLNILNRQYAHRRYWEYTEQ